MYSKRELRKQMLAKRAQLTKENIDEFSRLIIKQVKPYLTDQTVGIFYPIKNEVDLLSLLDLNVAFPKVDGDMTFHKYTGLFVKGAYNIPEPTGEECEVDVLLIPGSVFDLSGYRIGYGGGYYDKYLKPNHLKIGVCFDFQVVDYLPVEEHDVQLDMLITEKRLISFKE